MTSASNADPEKANPKPTSRWHRSFFARNSTSHTADNEPNTGGSEDEPRPTKWSMGVLNDTVTHEVPGSVLLLTGQNQPLGLRNAPARVSASSLPPQSPTLRRQSRQSKAGEGKKKTPDGAIILEPQPDDSHNDPLNWPKWRRDCALLSLGLYCMLGGGMTPILAAGFSNVAETYHVTTPKVALTTGLYMMGLGVGSVFASPTAILYGKRPVYLAGAIIFICTAVWAAASPSYNSLLIARIFQGVSLSPVECLPSATIAEIFFLHERAYRIGIYTLLLLGGKNLIPLVSAAIIQSLGWRWVFWIVAMVAGFCLVLLFLFVPETFWDRTPSPHSRKHSKMSEIILNILPQFHSRPSSRDGRPKSKDGEPSSRDGMSSADGYFDGTASNAGLTKNPSTPGRVASGPSRSLHVGFVPSDLETDSGSTSRAKTPTPIDSPERPLSPFSVDKIPLALSRQSREIPLTSGTGAASHERAAVVEPAGGVPPTPALHSFNSPYYNRVEKSSSDYLGRGQSPGPATVSDDASEKQPDLPLKRPRARRYTSELQERPPLTFVQQLRPWNGRLHQDKWWRVAVRPFILYAYPAVLWSSVVYACSIGWLIVLSESVSVIFRSKDTYNFSALSAGLIYLSPFIGGVLGTAVAGKVSDIIVRAMSKRNGGLYEPEFRLVMAAPVAVTTVIGLMGYGWSAQIHDAWIVPTIFFGIISFGCSLGSTTAITFCVDSYRQYAGEALVTLNFTKNIFHGLVFSLFFNTWLQADGSRKVFIWLGVIQLIFLSFTIPMYIFGKRARMWTVRKNIMEKF